GGERPPRARRLGGHDLHRLGPRDGGGPHPRLRPRVRGRSGDPGAARHPAPREGRPRQPRGQRGWPVPGRRRDAEGGRRAPLRVVKRLLAVALAQITGQPYAAGENRELTLSTARLAFERGAQLVVLPELIVPGYVADRERLAEVVEPLDGPTTQAWTAL